MTGAPSRVVLKLSGEALQGAADKADKADNNNAAYYPPMYYFIWLKKSRRHLPRVCKLRLLSAAAILCAAAN